MHSSDNTWEPAGNIYAKDKIEEFENKFQNKGKNTVRRRAKIVHDPDFDEDVEMKCKKFEGHLLESCYKDRPLD